MKLCFLKELETDEIVGIAKYLPESLPRFADPVFTAIYLSGFSPLELADQVHEEQIYESPVESNLQDTDFDSLFIYELVIPYLLMEHRNVSFLTEQEESLFSNFEAAVIRLVEDLV